MAITVRQLIDALQQVDPNLEVMTYNGEYGEFFSRSTTGRIVKVEQDSHDGWVPYYGDGEDSNPKEVYEI